MSFTDKVVVVTGAGGGMGTAVIKKFTDQGAKAVLLDIDEPLCRRTAEKLHLDDAHAFCIAADVANEKAVKDTVSKIVKHYGSIDALVNIAGIAGPSARTEDYAF